MVTVGLLIRLHSRPGKEGAVVAFLERAVSIVTDEPDTTTFLSVRFGPSEFGIVNAFPGETARQAHMIGHAAEALFATADELFEQPPTVELMEVLAAKGA
jgi:quinol monooxygenase YgiN